MKVSKVLPCFLFGVALPFFIMSCEASSNQNDEEVVQPDSVPEQTHGQDDEKRIIIESMSTSGTIVAAEYDESHHAWFADIEATNGRYHFRLYEDSDGWWEFYESGSENVKYAGFFSDGISNFASENVTLKLTVTGVRYNDRYRAVSERKEFEFVASPMNFSAVIPEVELWEMKNFEIPTVIIPDSVGENPFVGKTFSTESTYRTWIFSDSTVRYSSLYDDFSEYFYAYNTEEKLLYLTFKSNYYKEDGYISSFADLMEDYIAYGSGEDAAYEETYYEYSIPEIYKYEIEGDKLSLKEYFDGTLPTRAQFTYYQTDGCCLSFQDGGIHFWNSRTDIRTGFSCFKTNFSDGKFSGNLYESNDVTDNKKVGEIEGVYTVGGTAANGYTLSFKFTKLPSALLSLGFEVNKEYVPIPGK